MLLLFWWSPFIYCSNLDKVFICNHMAIRSRSHVTAYMVLMNADHLFIHNYIRSLLDIILTGLEPASYCLCVLHLSQLNNTIFF